MSIFRGKRVNRTNSLNGFPKAPHPFDVYASRNTLQPPRPNPNARFAPKPNNPKTVAYGDQLGSGYESSKTTLDKHMERATNSPDPMVREHHAKKAEAEKQVLNKIGSQIKTNAAQGDIWRNRY